MLSCGTVSDRLAPNENLALARPEPRGARDSTLDL